MFPEPLTLGMYSLSSKDIQPEIIKFIGKGVCPLQFYDKIVKKYIFYAASLTRRFGVYGMGERPME